MISEYEIDKQQTTVKHAADALDLAEQELRIALTKRGKLLVELNAQRRLLLELQTKQKLQHLDAERQL
jgi:hypothetical protein